MCKRSAQAICVNGTHTRFAVQVCPSSQHHLLMLNTLVCMELSPKGAQCQTTSPSLSSQACDSPPRSKDTREAFLKCY